MASKEGELYIYMNEKKVGILTQKSDRGLHFKYSENWIDESSQLPISLRLPVREQAYSGDLVYFYFDNLLPELKNIREKLAAKVKAKSADTFDLLGAVGRDCIGALQFSSVEEDMGNKKSISLPLSEKKIAQMIRNLKVDPLGINEKNEFRISLTGAQEKTALLKIGKKWFLPQGATPTTHIFKPSIGVINGGIDLTHSVENEWLCLQICKAFGLNVANAEMEQFEDIKVLVVERFDRLKQNKKILRVHQEDFCQALGFSAHQKYQNEGGPGIHQICEILKSSNDSLKDRRHFIKSQMIFWLLAGIDGHAKNFSISFKSAGFELCPLYDVLSAQPTIKEKQLNAFDVKMAMKIGDPGHYQLKDIVGRHWQQMEKKVSLPKGLINEIANEITAEIPKVIDSFKTLPDRFPQSLFDIIAEGMLKRSKLL